MRYLKEMFAGIFYLFAGVVLMFFPEIAKALSLPYVNTEELVNNKWNFWFGLVLTVFSVIFLVFRFFHAKRFCIIKVEGMNGKRIKTETVKSLAQQEFNIYNVNIQGKISQSNLYQTYSEMKAIFKVNNEKGLYDKYLFYGFTYTPFLFMLGQLYSDNRDYCFYHLRQTNGEEKRVRLPKFKIRNDGNELNKILNDKTDSRTLIIRVGTTVSADKMDISQFGTVDTLDISSKINGTEVINSKKRLYSWCDYIVDEIRSINVGKYDTINLLLATSAEMVFLLGKRLSKNSDPNLSVYHYDATAKYKYSWALQSKKGNDYENVVTIFTSRTEKNLSEK